MPCTGFSNMRNEVTITASLEIIDALRPVASSSLNASETFYVTPHPSIASSPRSSNVRSLTANTTRPALLARTSARVTIRTSIKVNLSPAKRTRPSSPRSKMALKWSSLMVPQMQQGWLAKISHLRRFLGKFNGVPCLHVASAYQCFPSPGHPPSLQHEIMRVFCFPYSHYRDWFLRMEKGVFFACTALPIDPVLQLHTFILHTMSKRCSNFPPTFVYGEWGCSSYASR